MPLSISGTANLKVPVQLVKKVKLTNAGAKQ